MIIIKSKEQMKKYYDEESQNYIFVEDGVLQDVTFEIDVNILEGCSCGCEDEECSCGCGDDCQCGCHGECDDDCECGCQEGGECHCHDDETCSCGCGCSEDCTCGCQEGGECHCHDDECGCHHHDDECGCGCGCDDCEDEEGTNGIIANTISCGDLTCGFIKANEIDAATLTVEQSIECERVAAYEISSVLLQARIVEAGVINSFVVIAKQIYAGSVDCIDIICDDISASENILTCTLFATNVTYNTFCIAKEKMKIVSAVGQRKNNILTCLDSEIIREKEGYSAYTEYLQRKDEE